MSIDSLDERPGCLGFLLRLFKPQSRESQVMSAYTRKVPLLSKDEKAYFEALQEVVGSRFAILVKVRQADIFEVKHSSYSIQTSAFNKVAKKHVDFLLCEPSSFTPILVIELDGGSHKRPDRIKRDELLDVVCKQVNLPVIHAKSAGRYDPNYIYQDIVSALKPTE